VKISVPDFLLNVTPLPPPLKKGGKAGLSFIDATLKKFAGVIKTTYEQWDASSRHGFLQMLDARVKVLFLLYFIIIVSIKNSIFPESGIFLFIFIIAIASRLNIIAYLKRVLLLGFIFGFLIALPSSLNIISNGKIILPLIHFAESHDFWIYHIPSQIGLTMEGLQVTATLTLRVINSVALSLLVLNTTRFADVIKAFKVFRVPDAFLLIITLSYQYIFIFAKTVEEIYLSMKSRLITQIGSNEARQIISGRITFIFRKTRIQCEEVYRAMTCRGFTDKIRLYHFRSLNVIDYASGFFFLSTGLFFLWI